MKESTKILRQKIHKYIELCNRRSTATDNFNISYYDMKAQELKEELDGQIYNVNWDLFVRALVKILKENNINHLISSEIGEEERDYISEVDNRYIHVTNMRHKVSINIGDKKFINSYFNTRSYWGMPDDNSYISLIDLITDDGAYKPLFNVYPRLERLAFEAYEKTEIASAKEEKSRLIDKLRAEQAAHESKIRYIKFQIAECNKKIRGNGHSDTDIKTSITDSSVNIDQN